MQEWHRLGQDVSGIRVAWTGGLLWELPPEQLETFAAEYAAWGYRIHRVDRRAMQQIEPHLAAPPDFALHMPDEGSVEPLAAALALLDAARSLGATIIADTQVRRLSVSAGRVSGVETNTGRHTGDVVVVACGVDTPGLVATVGLNLAVTGSLPCWSSRSPMPDASTASSCRRRCSCGKPRKDGLSQLLALPTPTLTPMVRQKPLR